MEGSSNSHSRNRKTREMPLRQVVLALAAPSALPSPHLRSATTKRAGRRDKPKEVVLAHSAPNAPPPQVHPTTKRAGMREKKEEVALTLSLPNAPPPQFNITTAATNDGTKNDYSLRKKRKQEEGAAAPDPTEFSSNEDYTPPVTKTISNGFVFLAADYGTPKNSLNQISLWDGILPTKEHAKFWIHTSNKYRFIDQGTNLRGKEFNLTLHWHVMPKKGKMFADKIVRPGYRLPLQEYR